MLFGSCDNQLMHAINIMHSHSHSHPAGDDAKLLSLAAPEQTEIFVYGEWLFDRFILNCASVTIVCAFVQAERAMMLVSSGR